MYMYVYVYVYICMHIYIYICMYIYIYICMHTFVNMYLHSYSSHICTHTHIKDARMTTCKKRRQSSKSRRFKRKSVSPSSQSCAAHSVRTHESAMGSTRRSSGPSARANSARTDDMRKHDTQGSLRAASAMTSGACKYVSFGLYRALLRIYRARLQICRAPCMLQAP